VNLSLQSLISKTNVFTSLSDDIIQPECVSILKDVGT